MPLIFPSTRNSRLTSLVLKGRSAVCHSRRFHVSRPYQLVDETLLLAHAAVETLHTGSGLSWGPSILLTGFLFRVLFLPLEIAYQRNKTRRQTYQPLLYAWRHEFMRQSTIKRQKREIPDGPRAAEWWVEMELQKKRKLLQLKYGYRSWVSILPLASAPAWIINMDVLRRMVGMKQSVISYFMNENGDIDPSLIPPDPSLAQESFLWIPSLALADPLSVLPITLWALVVSQVYLRFRELPLMTKKQIQALPTAKQKMLAELSTRVREVGILVGIFLGPALIYLEMPSTLILYWIAASGTLVLERLLVGRIVGVAKSLKPAIPLTARLKRAR
jgi:membrane protein insertase Oxa1/YidC/SpoIIIJ